MQEILSLDRMWPAWSEWDIRYGRTCGAWRSRLIDIDRAMLMTVAGATPNLLAVGLIPLPAATHAQI
jgi:hypothetical protein